MSGKTLIEMQNPVTQNLDAIKAFLTWKGRAVDPMPFYNRVHARRRPHDIGFEQ
jgi:hypothetical protein